MGGNLGKHSKNQALVQLQLRQIKSVDVADGEQLVMALIESKCRMHGLELTLETRWSIALHGKYAKNIMSALIELHAHGIPPTAHIINAIIDVKERAPQIATLIVTLTPAIPMDDESLADIIKTNHLVNDIVKAFLYLKNARVELETKPQKTLIKKIIEADDPMLLTSALVSLHADGIPLDEDLIIDIAKTNSQAQYAANRCRSIHNQMKSLQHPFFPSYSAPRISAACSSEEKNSIPPPRPIFLSCQMMRLHHLWRIS